MQTRNIKITLSCLDNKKYFVNFGDYAKAFSKTTSIEITEIDCKTLSKLFKLEILHF